MDLRNRTTARSSKVRDCDRYQEKKCVKRYPQNGKMSIDVSILVL